jgi:hypothetical protein
VSRSGYSEDLDTLDLGRWRGVVASATRGKRGQRFFRDLVAALDALPEKRLVKNELETRDGVYCALGALGRRKGLDLGQVDTYDHDELGEKFDIASQLAQETMFVNDEDFCHHRETDDQRWQRVRAWAVKQIVPTAEELAKPEVSNG